MYAGTSEINVKCNFVEFVVSRKMFHRESVAKKGTVLAEIRTSQDKDQIIILDLIGDGVWLVPDDWNGDNNKIECIGGGGGATACSGGEGGAYSAILNVKLVPGKEIAYSVGGGGIGGETTASPGLPTIFGGNSSASCLCFASGGVSATTTNGGRSSQIEQAVGVVKRHGGAGGTGSTWNGGGGGGAAGSVGHGLPGWAGSPGYTGSGGPGGSGNGDKSGSGGAGARGTSVGCGANGEDGNRYGGAGGGASYASTRGTGGTGAQGVIMITYRPVPSNK
jgi:hypothetical protein